MQHEESVLEYRKRERAPFVGHAVDKGFFDQLFDQFAHGEQCPKPGMLKATSGLGAALAFWRSAMRAEINPREYSRYVSPEGVCEIRRQVRWESLEDLLGRTRGEFQRLAQVGVFATVAFDHGRPDDAVELLGELHDRFASASVSHVRGFGAGVDPDDGGDEDSRAVFRYILVGVLYRWFTYLCARYPDPEPTPDLVRRVISTAPTPLGDCAAGSLACFYVASGAYDAIDSEEFFEKSMSQLESSPAKHLRGLADTLEDFHSKLEDRLKSGMLATSSSAA